ncbi:hypothetical protein LSTR_LSTR012687 [Laodelphax striatellus]|uniref:Uncharacterized protein n=1 Tax=Laodelphax striatellus TaxID=195883 RepID=A0A482WMZ5_LAOST|nr:hypothetical protein LSTR_LSTR012687 [Laodelphax striatellus]
MEFKYSNYWSEIEYFLDRNILHYEDLQGEKGMTIEIESEWNKEIRANDNITCQKKSDTPYSILPFTTTYIYINVSPGGTSSAQVPVWEKKENTDIFEAVTQVLWICRSANQTYLFHKVVNKLMSTNLKAFKRIYHSPETVVEKVLLPNNETALLVTHQKFVNGESTIKFVGTVKYVASTMLGAERFLKPFHFNHGRKVAPNPKDSRTWTLDNLRLVAHRQLETSPNPIPRRRFLEAGRLTSKLVDAGAERMLHLGRVWDRELISRAGQITCLHVVWDPAFPPEIFPRVAEYVDERLYLMQEDTFKQAFKIIETKVGLCTNKQEEFLKVRTVFQSKISIFAVRYTDGIEVQTISQEEDGVTKNILEVTETLYMDAMALRVFKYDGDLHESKIIVKAPEGNSGNSPGEPSSSKVIRKGVTSIGKVMTAFFRGLRSSGACFGVRNLPKP